MRHVIKGLWIVIISFLAIGASTPVKKAAGPTRWFENSTGGIAIWLPDDWQVTADEFILSAAAPAQDAYLQLSVLEDAEDLVTASQIYAAELDQIIQNFQQLGSEFNVSQNGLDLYGFEGTGTVDGVDFIVGICYVQTPKTVVMILSMHTPESGPRYERQFEMIVQSLKAI